MIEAVVDLSHHQEHVDFSRVAAAGVVAVILKASQGVTGVDPAFRRRAPEAKAAGLLVGAYHFATGADATAQAEHFLSVTGPDHSDLLVLDFEPNPSGSTMSAAQARSFVTHIHQLTGRWPGLYTGSSFIREQLGTKPDETLANCFLWIARYADAPGSIQATWPTWTLWQHTDGKKGSPPFSVDGVGPCDRNAFNGDLDGLKRLWGAA